MNIPHGGKLINRIANPKVRLEVLRNIKKYSAFSVSKETFKDIENVAQGVLSPLEGFMGKNDFKSVLEKGKLKNGLAWTMPVVFDVEPGQLKPRQKVLLGYGRGLALFSLKEIFPYSKKQFAKNIFGTLDKKHPGVQKIKKMRGLLAGGEITLIEKSPEADSKFILTPKQTRDIFQKRGWQSICAFQTRNVPHIGHEYIQKTALNITDGLFINPVIGKKKKGDFKDSLIKKTYEILSKKYFPSKRVVLGGLNYEMKYAGPKEAIHHAIMRKNFGCTHFIVGRDHAGLGNYYSPFAAHKIFQEYQNLGITPLFFSSFFYCKKCQGVASEKTCSHPKARIEFRGTNLREMILKRKNPSNNLMRPEVVKIIKKYKNPFTS